ncbi:MAG: histidine utilization repressor [Pseudomonadota bacterium]|nr:histidine utilization repressor [Pseudomonadota bacterium]
MSLHQRILSDIQHLILTGAWQPGRRIPVEHELMVQYQCSRMTVSKVMTQLANARMIERRRKGGSFVSRPHSQSAVLTIPDIKTEVAALGQPYSFAVLKRQRRRSSSDERAVLGIDRVIQVLQISCCHLAGARPFCFEQRLINLEAVPEAAQESFEQMAPGAWLLQRVPWALAEHRIRAVGADAEVAKSLKIRQKAAVLTIERTTRSADSTAITFVRLTYPGDLHELIATFTPPGDQAPLPGRGPGSSQPSTDRAGEK